MTLTIHNLSPVTNGRRMLSIAAMYLVIHDVVPFAQRDSTTRQVGGEYCSFSS